MPFQCYGVSDMLTDASHTAGVVKDVHAVVLQLFCNHCDVLRWNHTASF